MQRIAIVYDWMDKWGGVERLLLELHILFPDAQFYTSYYDKDKAAWAKNLSVHTSFIQKLPHFIKSNRILSLLLYPYAFESFDFSSYDKVISVTSSFAKGVITKPTTQHICILLTPPRYLWGQAEVYKKTLFTKLGDKVFGHYLRKWDYIAAQRPDVLFSISKIVKDRAMKYYKRDSKVVYPPFDTEYWNKLKATASISKNTDYFLVVSRLEPYKKIDMLIKVFNELKDKKLVVIGTGTEEKYLKSIASSNISFKHSLSDQELTEQYMGAEALLMPQQEDFGYVALEAQLMGCPVITYAKSGAAETILKQDTGFVLDENIDSWIEYIKSYKKQSFSSSKHLSLFDKEEFSKKIYGIMK